MFETQIQQTESTRVSVLVSHYRAVPKLRRCLEMLSKQSLPFHLIILNDDPLVPAEQIQNLVETYNLSSALILSDGINRGQARAYQELISKVRTEYFTFLNQDDQWVGSDYLKEATHYLDAHPETSVVCHRWGLLVEGGCQENYGDEIGNERDQILQVELRKARSFEASARLLRTITFLLNPSDLHFHGVARTSCAPVQQLREFRLLPTRLSNLVYPYCFSLVIQGKLSVIETASCFVNEIQRQKSYRRVPFLLLGVRRLEVTLRFCQLAWKHRQDGFGPMVAASLAIFLAPITPFIESVAGAFRSKSRSVRSTLTAL